MNLLKLHRFKAGLSQWELAMASGVPRWCIQLIESTYRSPSANERVALADALNIHVGRLFPKMRQRGQVIVKQK